MINHYFDVASTTQMSEGAINAYTQSAKEYRANPSSIHSLGKISKRQAETQREKTSTLLDIPLSSVIYTSGATESNSIVLNSLLWKRRKGRIVVSALEHPSISQYRVFFEERGFEWVWVKAPNGFIDLEHLTMSITKETLMVITLFVHNVFGSVQPIGEIQKIIKEKEDQFGTKIHHHVDSAQAIGKMKFSIKDLGVDSLSMSAHKIEGPLGVGLLYLKENSLLKPLSRGGNQEMGMRGGTENIPGISAFNYSLEETLSPLTSTLIHRNKLNSLLVERVKKIPHLEILRVNNREYVDSIITLSSPFIPSRVITRVLDDAGFCVSSTSACSNNTHSGDPFHTLITGFRPNLLKGAFRISYSHHHKEQDIIDLCNAIEKIIKEIVRQ